LKTTAVTTAVFTMGSATLASASGSTVFPGVVYTKDNPGKWAKKIGSHAPKVTVDGGKVNVVTEHGQAAKHYIVRHTLVQEDGTVIGATTFSPDDKPESSYELPAGYKGKLYVTSFCNLHDLWLSEVIV
jgi:superoxide reductase